MAALSVLTHNLICILLPTICLHNNITVTATISFVCFCIMCFGLLYQSIIRLCMPFLWHFRWNTFSFCVRVQSSKFRDDLKDGNWHLIRPCVHLSLIYLYEGYDLRGSHFVLTVDLTLCFYFGFLYQQDYSVLHSSYIRDSTLLNTGRTFMPVLYISVFFSANTPDNFV